jgi:hypothetical protein
MSADVLCGQPGCGQIAVRRYTWPGRVESTVCLDHYVQLKNLANAMGMPLHFIKIDAAAMLTERARRTEG